ncbi:MAG: hypothetical protein JST80_01360 [Bdellovibrionales bacterium]|nr:hypothetical protein [Bdellovibrionales bacterium]
MKLFSGSLAAILLFTQTVAFAEGTKVSLQVATLSNIQSEEGLADFIDQNIGQVQAAEAQEQAAEQLSKHGLKVEARWNKKLTKIMPKIAGRFADTYAGMTDEQIDAQITDMKTKAVESQNETQLTKANEIAAQTQVEKRQSLTALSTESAKTYAPELAHQIGKAGGAVKFLMKAKKMGANFSNKYAKYACIILAVILIWACFGIPVVIAELLVGAFLTMAIMSAFSPYTGSGRY